MMLRSSYKVFLLLLAIVSSCGIKKKTSAPAALLDTAKAHEIYYAAEMQYTAGNLKEADSLFRKYIKTGDKILNTAPAYYRLACIANSNKNNPEAAVYISKARLLDSSNKYYKLYDATLAIESRNYKKTADIYASLITTDKRAWTLHADAVKFYYYAGEYRRAIEICNIWEKNFSLMEPIAENRSNAYRRLGDNLSAAMEWEKLSKKYPDRRQYRITLANFLSAAGNQKRWKSIMDSLLNENPNDAALLNSLCRESRNLTARERLNYAEKLAATGAPFSSKWNCGSSFLSKDFPLYAQTGNWFEIMMKYHPDEPSLLLYYADFLMLKREHGKAAELMKKGLPMMGPSISRWQKYIDCLKLTGDVNGLLSAADSLEILYPNNAIAYKCRSYALLEKKEFEKAKTEAASGMAFAFDPNDIAELQTITARILLAQGNQPEALKVYNKIAVTYPENAGVMHLGADLLTESDPNQALALINQAIAADTNNGWYIQSRIRIKKKLRLYPENDILLLAKLLPDNAQAQEMAGDLYYEYKQHLPDALRCWKKAMTCKNANMLNLQQKIQEAERL